MILRQVVDLVPGDEVRLNIDMQLWTVVRLDIRARGRCLLVLAHPVYGETEREVCLNDAVTLA